MVFPGTECIHGNRDPEVCNHGNRAPVTAATAMKWQPPNSAPISASNHTHSALRPSLWLQLCFNSASLGSCFFLRRNKSGDKQLCPDSCEIVQNRQGLCWNKSEKCILMIITRWIHRYHSRFCGSSTRPFPVCCLEACSDYASGPVQATPFWEPHVF